MPTRDEIREEQIRMMRLQVLVDLTVYRLGWTPLSRKEAQALIERTRGQVLEMFPGKDEVFDLVLRPRFQRTLTERALTEWGIGDALN